MMDFLRLRAADGAMLIAVLAIGWSFYRAHMGPHPFNLFDLLMEHGRVSKMSCILMGSFFVTSWLLIRLTIDGTVTEGYFTSYGGIWVAPLIARMFAPAPRKEEEHGPN